jgi:hypothetical protein
MHPPALHVPLQTLPHEPQFIGSELRSTHWWSVQMDCVLTAQLEVQPYCVVPASFELAVSAHC